MPISPLFTTRLDYLLFFATRHICYALFFAFQLLRGFILRARHADTPMPLSVMLLPLPLTPCRRDTPYFDTKYLAAVHTACLP